MKRCTCSNLATPSSCLHHKLRARLCALRMPSVRGVKIRMHACVAAWGTQGSGGLALLED